MVKLKRNHLHEKSEHMRMQESEEILIYHELITISHSECGGGMAAENIRDMSGKALIQSIDENQ